MTKRVHREERDLLHEIRIAYHGLIKEKKGLAMSDLEKQAVERLIPVDVTHVLLREIDTLNQQIICLIDENTNLKDKLTEKAFKESGPIDIDKP